MFDVIDRILAQLAAAPPAAASDEVARRQVANTLQLWRFCPRSTCRRGRCCRGQPKDCLQVALPVLPPPALTRLVAACKRRGAWTSARDLR